MTTCLLQGVRRVWSDSELVSHNQPCYAVHRHIFQHFRIVTSVFFQILLTNLLKAVCHHHNKESYYAISFWAELPIDFNGELCLTDGAIWPKIWVYVINKCLCVAVMDSRDEYVNFTVAYAAGQYPSRNKTWETHFCSWNYSWATNVALKILLLNYQAQRLTTWPEFDHREIWENQD